MKIGIVTVTYGNRIEHLSKVLKSIDSEYITQICVVINGSTKSLFEKLSEIKKVKFIFNEKNLGSAKGFKQGIKYLKSFSDVDFLWLLDDDNLPKPHGIENLIKYYEKYNFKNKNDALLSYRPDRSVFLEALNTNNGSIMLKGKNSALGFSLFRKNKQFSNYKKEGLKVAPYGGLFFHKKLIETIGYPDESYFVYGDDYDFTIRVSKNGGVIKLVKDSLIEDLEKSFHLKEKRKRSILNTRYHNTNNLDRIFYSVRNGIRFEIEHMVDNKMIYYFNLFVYSSIIGVLLVFNLQKFVIFYKGVFLGILNKS